MRRLSAEKKYEKAALLRDQIKSIEKISEKQRAHHSVDQEQIPDSRKNLPEGITQVRLLSDRYYSECEEF